MRKVLRAFWPCPRVPFALHCSGHFSLQQQAFSRTSQEVNLCVICPAIDELAQQSRGWVVYSQLFLADCGLISLNIFCSNASYSRPALSFPKLPSQRKQRDSWLAENLVELEHARAHLRFYTIERCLKHYTSSSLRFFLPRIISPTEYLYPSLALYDKPNWLHCRL